MILRSIFAGGIAGILLVCALGSVFLWSHRAPHPIKMLAQLPAGAPVPQWMIRSSPAGAFTTLGPAKIYRMSDGSMEMVVDGGGIEVMVPTKVGS